MKLGIDLDGVLADHVRYLIEYLRRSNPSLDITVDDVDRWNAKVNGIRFKDLFEYYLRFEEFTLSIPPIENSIESIDKLYDRYEIYIVTARPKYCRETTIKWLNMHGFKYHKLYIDLDYERIDLDFDVLIDDNPFNIIGFACKRKKAIILDQPWNRKLPMNVTNEIRKYIVRCKDWKAITQVLLE